MKKIISIIMIALVGLSIIPKTLVNEKHVVLESTTSVYTKEEVDSLLSAIRTNITNNTNELTNIKSELTTLQNSLKDYALKTSLNTTNSNIDGLNTVASSNASKITSLETLYNGGNATASQILKGKTAIVGSKQVTGTIESLGATTYTPTTSNQTIASGKYLSGAQTIAGDADLISANIKSGAEIFGVKGNSNVVDTSAGTATASQILSGKIAFVDGTRVTGTMANKSGTTTSASTVTESGDNALINIPENGYYSTDSKLSVPIEAITSNTENVVTGTFVPPTVGKSVSINLGFKPDIVLLYSQIYQRTTIDTRRFTGVIDGINCGEFTMSGQDTPMGSATSEITITDTGFSFTAAGNGQWNLNSDASSTYIAIKLNN